ncbi:MAG: sterol carrier protein domain-containing protein [Kouleothrix sp.]|nr:sterol carrier protein domain-containing protein [Kouleothrix sp.]
MPTTLSLGSADTPGALARLRALVSGQGGQATRALDLHLARPRYRPALTRVAALAGAVAGYALLAHRRLRLGAATIDAGLVERVWLQPGLPGEAREALLGDAVGALAEEGLPLALLHGAPADEARLGFAEHRYRASVELSADVARTPDSLRAAEIGDLDDLAALYEASYRDAPLSDLRAAPDWRAWLGERRPLALEDARGRLVAYALPAEPDGAAGALTVVEAGVADAGVARTLCEALLARAGASGYGTLRLALSPWHPLAQAALQLGGVARIERPPQEAAAALAGVVDLPLLLGALLPELERRLARSRYAGWSGGLRIELATERAVLALAGGHATVIDGSRPADLRLRRVELAALAQLCLGYRAAADLRATGGLDCDDSALGLLDALFPASILFG